MDNNRDERKDGRIRTTYNNQTNISTMQYETTDENQILARSRPPAGSKYAPGAAKCPMLGK
jgi:hypothetical protein